MQGLSEPCSFGYMAIDAEPDQSRAPASTVFRTAKAPMMYRMVIGFLSRVGVRGQGANPAPSVRVLRLRLLLREVLAGGFGGGIGHDPGRVLRLGRARELLAQVRAEHLGVDADLLGEDLGRERCRHGTYLLEASASLIDAIVLSYMRRCLIARGRDQHLQTPYIYGVRMLTLCKQGSASYGGTPPTAPPKDRLTLGVRCARAKRAEREIFCHLEAAYSA